MSSSVLTQQKGAGTINYLIKKAEVLQNGQYVRRTVRIEDGKVWPGNGQVDTSDTEVIDGTGLLLTPGLIDIHTHAIGRHIYENGPESIFRAAELLPRFGTTCTIPTIVPDTEREDMFSWLSSLARATDQVEHLNMPCLHLEGPFVAIPGAGCKPVKGNVSLLKEIIDAGNGKVGVMSIAPEVEDIIPVIETMVEEGIIPFITHTRAGVEETQAAIEAGARHATHFYDVFDVPPAYDGGVRPVGAVEAILADPRCTIDFIADGVHVHPVAIKAALAAKGPEKLILITDSNIGAGLPEGTYDVPWGYPVKVTHNNGVRIDDPNHPSYGNLAGSALTMDVGINNLMDWLPLPEQNIWQMATSNPARLLGLENKGVIKNGADADLVLWKKENGKYRPLCTWAGGKRVFNRM